MAETLTSQCIHAGCILVHKDNALVPPELLASYTDGQWYWFNGSSDDGLLPSPCLSTELQDILLCSTLAQFSVLFVQGWIRLEFSPVRTADVNVLGRIRVYILPQDVNRSAQSSRGEVSKPMAKLLRAMEYSHDCWCGRDTYTPQNQAATRIDSQAGPEKPGASLLALFNEVPSPDPRPENASDADLQWSMQCLLDSQVDGLTSTLYPYQGRSAALMLQRELEPDRIVDFRLHSAIDQTGQTWYYDDVSGAVLKEPRYYDRPRGGILAEEMGTGKTLICLALILSTRSEPTKPPEPFVAETPPRRGVASLVDMAAAATNKHSVAWKRYFDAYSAQLGHDYHHCRMALNKPDNQAFYHLTKDVESRRSTRYAANGHIPSKKVFLSHLTLVIVPRNLLKQWQNEIKKHTTGLKVLVVSGKDTIPTVAELLSYDILLFSDARFEQMYREGPQAEHFGPDDGCRLENIHFKRCIIDEGHKLGNGSRAWKNDLMRMIDCLQISARWVVTGTPSRGLYGLEVDELRDEVSTLNDVSGGIPSDKSSTGDAKTRLRIKEEKVDLQRIGNLAVKYLKVRPWANSRDELGDSLANWTDYVKEDNRRDCVKNTLNSLLVRHRMGEVSTLLPPVNEKVVVLDGSFQDQLSLNLFSMMIIFNSVQSQRTDRDYFFHESQRNNLVQLVKNLRQASFFGGVFFSAGEISKAVDTAQDFLDKGAVPMSREDETLLRQAIEFGKHAMKNTIKDISNRFHAMPLYLRDFPGGQGKAWSLDDKETEDGLVCTDAGLIRSLQNFLDPWISSPNSLQVMIDNGGLSRQGVAERALALATASDGDGRSASQTSHATALAGNTALGDDFRQPPKVRNLSAGTSNGDVAPAHTMNLDVDKDVEVARPLAKTRIVSTVSAKLSYLVDSIIKHQDSEQILIFYDNDNVAFYLASVLEILQIQHLIYSKVGLSPERRAQYVATFTDSAKFRVMLMDITQAAFGLDMRSASRIYFISPVLNPQVVSQAIGRARRISQKKPVWVETLVLRNSIEEVMIDRRERMTQAEHSRIKNVLDDGKIKEWIRNPKINPMSEAKEGLEQTALLASPQYVFGRGFGRTLDPDEGLILNSPEERDREAQPHKVHVDRPIPFSLKGASKRPRSPDEMAGINGIDSQSHPKRRARIAWADGV